MEKIAFEPGVKEWGVTDGASGDGDELACMEWTACKEEWSELRGKIKGQPTNSVLPENSRKV